MMNPAASPQEKRTIRVKDFLDDFHAGMEDAKLLLKYHLTPVGLEKFYTMLVERGILATSEVQARYSPRTKIQDRTAQTDSEKPSFICPACLAAHDTMFDICPCCGVSFQELMSTTRQATSTNPADEDAFVPGPQPRDEQNSEFFAAANNSASHQGSDPGRSAAWQPPAVGEQINTADKYSLRPSRASFDDSLDEIITGMPLEEYYSESPQASPEVQPKCDRCDIPTKPALRDIYDRTRSLHVLGASGIALLLGFFAVVTLSFFDGYSFGRLLVVYFTALFFLAGGVLLAVGSFLYLARERVFYCSSCQRMFPRA